MFCAQVFLCGLMNVVAEVIAEASDFDPAIKAFALDPGSQGSQFFGWQLTEGAEEQAGSHGGYIEDRWGKFC